MLSYLFNHSFFACLKFSKILIMSAPYGLPTSCVGREKFSPRRKKTYTEKRKGPYPPLNMLHDQVMLVRWWVGGPKSFRPSTHHLNILHPKVMLVRWWVGDQQSFRPPNHHLNILHDQVMLVRWWVGGPKSFIISNKGYRQGLPVSISLNCYPNQSISRASFVNLFILSQ